MSNTLYNMLEALKIGDGDVAGLLLSEAISKKLLMKITEDHDKDMTVDQMVKHLTMLHGKAADSQQFMSLLGLAVGIRGLDSRQIGDVVRALSLMPKHAIDEIIHKMEASVGYTYKAKLQEMVFNYPTASIPNVYKNRKVKKKDRKLPTARKSVYGGLGQNASGASYPVDGEAGGEGAGGGE